MKIKVTADSTCDLSPALLTQYDVTLAPLTVIKDGTDYVDGRTITPGDFPPRSRRGSLCSTAAVSVGEYQALFARFAGSCDGLVHVTIGSDFSACYQNACLAAAEFPNVRVIDSRNLSTGQGHVVLEACRLGKSAASLEALCQELEQLTGKVEASFLLNRLDYMVKGGRCSTVAALGANLLNLKPCIEVRDGKMQVVKKYRGPLCQVPGPLCQRPVGRSSGSPPGPAVCHLHPSGAGLPGSRAGRLWTSMAISRRSMRPPPGAPSPATAAPVPWASSSSGSDGGTPCMQIVTSTWSWMGCITKTPLPPTGTAPGRT